MTLFVLENSIPHFYNSSKWV